MSRPTRYIDRYLAYPDGSWEWACYWCNESLLVHPDDAISVVTTTDGLFCGVQCRRCAEQDKDRRGSFPIEVPYAT